MGPGAGAGRQAGRLGGRIVRVHMEKWEEIVDEETEWNAGDRACRFIKEREKILEAR